VTGRRSPVIRTGVLGTVLAATDRTVWQLQPHRLVAVDVASRHVRLRVGLGQAAYALAAGGGAVLVPSYQSDTLTKIDPRTGARSWRSSVPHFPQAVAVGAGSVWLACVGPAHSGRGGVLVPDGPGIAARIDPKSDAVRSRVRVGRGPQAIAVADGAVWVLSGRGVGADDTLDRVDVRTNRVVATFWVPHWSSSVAVGRRYAWVVSSPKSAGGVIMRIETRTGRAVTRRIPRSWTPAGVALAAGHVWVADPGVAQLIRIDPHTLRVTKRVTLPIS
jgi:outer membrane protein assembly factor BamB